MTSAERHHCVLNAMENKLQARALLMPSSCRIGLTWRKREEGQGSTKHGACCTLGTSSLLHERVSCWFNADGIGNDHSIAASYGVLS